ncbi:hypothetical protein L6278_00085 [Candidatus Parcubacteria bacterium]|nr:hypothetical protein [Patescibacteria group bacterium]MCG2686519.1 hypothetical protein [Candidatus Parcubacteria bacterium]
MNNINKILNLVKKTNDKVIITDENGEASFMLMPFTEYETIVENKSSVKDLSEKELLDQIDRDIAIWKQDHNDEEEDDLLLSDPLGPEHNFDDEIFDDEIDDEITEEKNKPVQNDPIKYEDIPPPPDIIASDIFTPEEKPIIDMSYDDSDDGTDDDKTSEFEEEPIY